MAHFPRRADALPKCCSAAFSESFSSTILSVSAYTYIFWLHILTFESLLVLLSAAGAAAFFVFYTTGGDDGYIAAKLDFSLLSMAIVFPLHFLLDQTFKRREQALAELAQVKGLVANITLSLLTWDFPSVVTRKYDGRSYLPPDFNHHVLNNSVNLLITLKTYLKAPTVTRNANMVLFFNRVAEGKKVEEATMQKLLQHVNFSYYLVEVMKERGLPPNEASRVNGYHTSLVSHIERLRNFKWYRTPHATRAFGFVYIVILPWFNGPYYAWVAGRVVGTVFDFNTDEPLERVQHSAATAAFAVCLAMITSLVLIGLISVQRLLEDPFLDHGADYIHVSSDIDVLIRTLQARFKEAQGRKLPKRDFAAAIDGDVRYDLDGFPLPDLEYLNDGVMSQSQTKEKEGNCDNDNGKP